MGRGYTIQRATNTGFTQNLTTFTSPTPTFADFTAVAGTRYWYRVRATQPPAVNGALSTSVNLTPSAPATPGALTLTTTAPPAPALASITLTWTGGGGVAAGSYTIQRANNAGFTGAITVSPVAGVPGTQRTFTDTGLTRNTRFWYRIQAVNGYGVSGFRTANIRTPV